MLERITGEYEIEFVDGDGDVLSSAFASVETLSDDATQWVTVPIPEDMDFESVRTVRRRTDGGDVEAEAPVTTVNVLHIAPLGPQP